jgi:hypothetical protein
LIGRGVRQNSFWAGFAVCIAMSRGSMSSRLLKNRKI